MNGRFTPVFGVSQWFEEPHILDHTISPSWQGRFSFSLQESMIICNPDDFTSLDFDFLFDHYRLIWHCSNLELQSCTALTQSQRAEFERCCLKIFKVERKTRFAQIISDGDWIVCTRKCKVPYIFGSISSHCSLMWHTNLINSTKSEFGQHKWIAENKLQWQFFLQLWGHKEVLETCFKTFLGVILSIITPPEIQEKRKTLYAQVSENLCADRRFKNPIGFF